MTSIIEHTAGADQCTLYIVRHGETEWNVNGLIQGQKDSILTAKGVSQAETTAKNLKDVHFDAIYSSDLLRAKRTAEIIKLERELVVQTSKALRERRFGLYEGTLFADFVNDFKSYFEKVENLSYEEGKKLKPDHHVESDEDIISRFMIELREISVAHTGKTVLVVTHGGCIRTLLVHLGYASYRDLPVGAIPNAGYAKILCDGVDFVIKEVKGTENAMTNK